MTKRLSRQIPVISKTDFLLYRECKKNAWLKIHRPDIYYNRELSEFEKAMIETGNEVEEYARKLFPTGILIEGRDDKAALQTKKLIAQNSGTVFQPVFVIDGLMAAIDILQYDKDSKSWTLLEVKASNSVKDKLHLADAAFQVELLHRCGIKLGMIGLLHLNPKYVRNGELDLIKLFITDDVGQILKDMQPQIAAEIEGALAYLTSDTEPNGPCECVYKGRSQHCTTFSYSNPHIPEYSVHDIARIGVSKSKLTELIDGNIFHLHEIPEHIELSDIQTNQVHTKIAQRPIIHKDKINGELRGLKFPLYFIDYETFPAAIPRFDGFSPYQQIPFQYSLHKVEHREDIGVEPDHFEFLHTENSDPSAAFAHSLEKHIGPIGTIIVWNKKFECKINEELAKRLPQVREFIDGLNARVYDLMDIFSKQYYVHPDFYGSTSIKYILPILAPDLSYKKLEIQEGGTATQKWNEMMTGNLESSEKAQIATNLKEYCKLDTYAMYRIWKYLQNL